MIEGSLRVALDWLASECELRPRYDDLGWHVSLGSAGKDFLVRLDPSDEQRAQAMD